MNPWWKIIRLRLQAIWWQATKGELAFTAAALAFYSLLALIPSLALTLSFFKALDLLQGFAPQIEVLILKYLQGPAGTDGVVFLRKSIGRIHAGGLGLVGASGLFFVSYGLVSRIDHSFQKVWQVHQKPQFSYKVFTNLLIMISFPLVLASISLVSSLSFLGVIHTFIPVSWIHFLFLCLILTLLFKFVPRTPVPWVFSLVGAIFSTLGLYSLFFLFKLATQKVFIYSKIYGSLAVIPGFLIWLQITWIIILAGVSISAGLTRKEYRIDYKNEPYRPEHLHQS